MSEHKFAFIEPGRDRRNRKQQLKQLLRQPVSPERGRAMAELANEFHKHRELNLAMDTARQCLEQQPAGLADLEAAYLCHDRADLLIEDLAMLGDLARWIGNEDLSARVRSRTFEHAVRWCGRCDGRERERRLGTLRRRFDDSLADDVNLALI